MEQPNTNFTGPYALVLEPVYLILCALNSTLVERRRDKKDSNSLWLMVKDAQLLTDRGRKKDEEDKEKAKIVEEKTSKIKKKLSYEEWVKQKENQKRRESITSVQGRRDSDVSFISRRDSNVSVGSRRDSLQSIDSRRLSTISLDDVKPPLRRRMSYEDWAEQSWEKEIEAEERKLIQIEKKILKRKTSLKPTVVAVAETDTNDDAT